MFCRVRLIFFLPLLTLISFAAVLITSHFLLSLLPIGVSFRCDSATTFIFLVPPLLHIFLSDPPSPLPPLPPRYSEAASMPPSFFYLLTLTFSSVKRLHISSNRVFKLMHNTAHFSCYLYLHPSYILAPEQELPLRVSNSFLVSTSMVYSPFFCTLPLPLVHRGYPSGSCTRYSRFKHLCFNAFDIFRRRNPHPYGIVSYITLPPPFFCKKPATLPAAASATP